jgi:membrane protein DedA with SNARE-associated domain
VPTAAVNPASRLIRRLALLTFFATTLASYVGSAFSPYLLVESPLLLLVLAPMGRHVALAAPFVPLLALLAVVLLRRLVALTASWALGRIYGPGAVEWIEARSARGGAVARHTEQLFARWGTPLLFVAPTNLVCALAGAAGVRPAVVFGLAAAGELAWTLALYRFGTAISEWTGPLVAFLGEHMLVATLITIGLALLYYWFGRRRDAKQP